MNYQLIPNIWPLLISGLLTLFLGIFTLLKRNSAKGSGCFAVSMFIVTLWSLPNALELSATDLSTKLFWANVQYFAYCYSPLSLLALCMQFTGFDNWIKNKRILWLAVLPTIIILLVWTNDLHGLIRYDVHMDYSGAFPVIAKKYGAAFYIHALYSYSLNITSIILLIRAVFYRNTIYRKQVVPLLIGVFFIVMPNVLYILGMNPFGYDITPAFFGPGGLIMLWAIFRYRMFDLVPLARETVIETMKEGFMVMDIQDRILDMNPAFKKLIGLQYSGPTPLTSEEIIQHIPELADIFYDKNKTYAEFTLLQDQATKIYEIVISPLTNHKNKYIGRLATVHEITEKKQEQQEFLKQQWRMAVMEEREHMARDMHDNLGQVLGFINFQAQAIRQELINQGIEFVTDRFDLLVEAAQSAHSEIREYISDIRTSVAKEKDFMSSLINEISNFEHQTGLHVDLHISEYVKNMELKPNIGVNVINIVKEALNNIRKHAQAKNVWVYFERKEKLLYLIVADDGRGFELIQYNSKIKSKFGLDIMRERAAEIGVEIKIESVIGKGSRIVLCLPLEEGGN
jgi:PAS domain S-box-containing protein